MTLSPSSGHETFSVQTHRSCLCSVKDNKSHQKTHGGAAQCTHTQNYTQVGWNIRARCTQVISSINAQWLLNLLVRKTQPPVDWGQQSQQVYIHV